MGMVGGIDLNVGGRGDGCDGWSILEGIAGDTSLGGKLQVEGLGIIGISLILLPKEGGRVEEIQGGVIAEREMASLLSESLTGLQVPDGEA